MRPEQPAVHQVLAQLLTAYEHNLTAAVAAADATQVRLRCTCVGVWMCLRGCVYGCDCDVHAFGC